MQTLWIAKTYASHYVDLNFWPQIPKKNFACFFVVGIFSIFLVVSLNHSLAEIQTNKKNSWRENMHVFHENKKNLYSLSWHYFTEILIQLKIPPKICLLCRIYGVIKEKFQIKVEKNIIQFYISFSCIENHSS